jgi:hypothetical protein
MELTRAQCPTQPAGTGTGISPIHPQARRRVQRFVTSTPFHLNGVETEPSIALPSLAYGYFYQPPSDCFLLPAIRPFPSSLGRGVLPASVSLTIVSNLHSHNGFKHGCHTLAEGVSYLIISRSPFLLSVVD